MIPYKKIIMVLMIPLIMLSSCTKKKTYPDNSIYGTWVCIEESANLGYRQYTVSISFENNDSSLIRIFNFYNLDAEVYGLVEDTLITLLNTDINHSFEGTGHIERDFSAIYWQYSYYGDTSNPFIEAVYQRP
jgi:hypothetical protein